MIQKLFWSYSFFLTKGPKAGLIVGYVPKDIFDNEKIDVTYECEDGSTKKSTATLKAQIYGDLDSIERLGTFYSTNDCLRSEECIKSINKDLKRDGIVKEFENCFRGRGTFSDTIQAKKDTRGSSAGHGNQANPLLLKYAFIFVVLMISMFIWINWTHNTVFFVNSRLI